MEEKQSTDGEKAAKSCAGWGTSFSLVAMTVVNIHVRSSVKCHHQFDKCYPHKPE